MKSLTIRLSLVALCLSIAGAADAGNMSWVTIDIQPEEGRVEPGALHLPDAPPHPTGGVDYSMPIGDGISVTINPIDQNGDRIGKIDWRDRGDQADPVQDLARLGEDLVKNSSGVIRVEIEGLMQGKWDITSYHFDPLAAQAESFDIWAEVPGGSGNFEVVGTGAADAGPIPLNSVTTADIEGTASVFSVVSNGVDPVTIIFDARGAADLEIPLNGLMLHKAIPEPTTCMLLLLSGLLLAGRRR